MRKVHILVEGQTEEAFVGKVLAKHLEANDVHLNPIVLTTKRVPSGKNYRGGVGKWQQIREEALRLLRDSSADAVTTLIDYYGLPTNVPGMGLAGSQSAGQRVSYVESMMNTDIDNPRFHANLLVHEFEALLFADPDMCGRRLGNHKVATEMRKALGNGRGPEDVNNQKATAPSKRLVQAFPAYQKVLHGPTIAESIGLPRIRSTCPHFDQWLSWLENL